MNLPLAVVEIWFCLIVNFNFRFGQEVKVKLGHFFVNIFWQLTICTMVQKLWIYLLRLLRYDFFKIFNFDFRFGQEVKVKLGHFFVNIFWQLTICTMVQKFWIYLLRLLRYDFFKDIQLWLPVWTGSKGQIRVTFLSIFFDKQRSVQWLKNFEFTSCGCWDMIFLNIKLWFIVIRYLMTSSWRHKFCIIYLLCFKYMPSFKFVWRLQVCVFL